MSVKKDAGTLAVFTGLLAIYSVLSDNEFFGFIEEITWQTYYLSQLIFLVLLTVAIGYAIAVLLGGGGVGQFFKDLFEVGSEAKRFAKEQDEKRRAREKDAAMMAEEKKKTSTDDDKKLAKIEEKEAKTIEKKSRRWKTSEERKQERAKKKQEKCKLREAYFTETETYSHLGTGVKLVSVEMDPITANLAIRGDKNLRFWILVTLLIAMFGAVILYPEIVFKIWEVLP